jgi:hypothetical protein
MTKICDYCSAMVDDSAPTCPNCNSSSFTPGPSSQPKGQITYNIYQAGHPGYQAPAASPPYQPKVAPPAARFVPKVSGKSRTVALLLVIFLGFAAIHRDYVGREWSGTPLTVCSALTVFVSHKFIIPVIILVFADFILILSGFFKDKDGLRVKKW